MRQLVKAANSGTDGHFSIGRGAATSSAASTPRKPRKNATATPKTPTSGKRKKTAKAAVDDDVDATAVVKDEREATPLGPAFGGVALKKEPREDDVFMGHDSPSKRVRRASSLHPGMVSNFGEDSQTELDSSVSEYLPEDSYKLVEDEEYWFK
ncbi:hypothetical protein BBP40_005228 [Aspergillus hancockii]|nr:hypothetical protein BBP40_005228 [Aspergillus hancockii]